MNLARVSLIEFVVVADYFNLRLFSALVALRALLIGIGDGVCRTTARMDDTQHCFARAVLQGNVAFRVAQIAQVFAALVLCSELQVAADLYAFAFLKPA